MTSNNNQAVVNNGNAHHNFRCSGRDSRVAIGVGGGSGTLIGIVMLSFSVMDFPVFASTFGVTARALLVLILAGGALAILHGTKPARQQRKSVMQVNIKTTPLYSEPDDQQRKFSLIGLVGGSVVTGALMAIVVSVVLAYAVTTLTSLLK
jgi:hypothetical protein